MTAPHFSADSAEYSASLSEVTLRRNVLCGVWLSFWLAWPSFCPVHRQAQGAACRGRPAGPARGRSHQSGLTHRPCGGGASELRQGEVEVARARFPVPRAIVERAEAPRTGTVEVAQVPDQVGGTAPAG